MSEEKQQEAKTAVAEKDTPTADQAAPETEVKQDTAPAKAAATDAPAGDTPERRPRRRGGNNRRNQRRGRRGGRQERVRPEFDQKIVSIRRVTRVMAGGRRFSFSVSMVIGDKKGKVGVGVGKAGDTQLAIEKAVRNAKKNMIVVPLTKEVGDSLPAPQCVPYLNWLESKM
jgi:small subunit ribosomal protein S5